MTESIYRVSLGERVLRVHVRHDGDRVLVRVGDGDERSVQVGAVHGSLRWLLLGDRAFEFMAAADRGQGRVGRGGLEFRAEVVDEARARLATVAGGRAAGHARRELRAPMPG